MRSSDRAAMTYCNIPPSRLAAQATPVGQPTPPCLAEFTTPVVFYDGLDSTPVQELEWRRRPRISSSPSQTSVLDDPSSPLQLNEVIHTFSETESPNGLWGDDVGGANTWGAPQNSYSPGWGSPPATDWGPPLAPTDTLDDMGVLRSEVTTASAGIASSPYLVRFRGYSIASDGHTYLDEIMVSLLTHLVEWPVNFDSAELWPVVPPPFRLNVSSLPFATRDAYAEFRRIFRFFAQAHPQEDAEWLNDRWQRMTQTVEDETSVPGYLPERALHRVLHVCRDLLPVRVPTTSAPLDLIDNIIPFQPDAWEGPPFDSWSMYSD
ncbi:hypothetical protein K466DRAFT_568798 [Polyporus arcularius HHB13444]|uniref:Uncharacterized protein n=1 Tax=Polyporus arcularius HHB13444 TaxID=1314778 RepID=A0A5C3NXK1_9APHY|nr:hypothetical protein K466DRAFT_568798 [Polyporus arcularius HHB13444]